MAEDDEDADCSSSFCGECYGYCGVLESKVENGSATCGPCPWGWRVREEDSFCVPCEEELPAYDWLYLGFMALLPFLLHSFFIEYCAGKSNKSSVRSLLVQHLSSFLEVVLAAVFSLLVLLPRGSLFVHGCGVRRLKDWYTMFFNPTINYTTTLHCTYEAVYPLYSLPLIFLGFCLLMLAGVRPLLLRVCRPPGSAETGGKRESLGGGGAVYAALYFYPILSLLHCLFAGFLYYAYPYLLLVAALATNSLHFALYPQQTVKALFLDTVKSGRNIVVGLTHCFLFAYCVAAFTQFADPPLHVSLLGLIPVPAVFYILTAPLSDPRSRDRL